MASGSQSSIAVACAVVVLLQVPVGLLAFLSRGPSGDPLGDGILVLAFAIPGLLLVGYLWLTSRILGGRSRDASMEPEGGGA